MLRLKETLRQKIEEHRPRTTRLLKDHSDVKIGEVTIGQAIGGARGVRCLVTDTSYLDPMEAPQVMAGFVGPLMVGAAAGWPADTTPVEGGYSVQGERLTSTLETDIRISAA